MIVRIEYEDAKRAKKIAYATHGQIDFSKAMGPYYVVCDVDRVDVVNPVYVVRYDMYRAVVKGVKDGKTVWRKYFYSALQLEAGQRARAYKEGVLSSAKKEGNETR